MVQFEVPVPVGVGGWANSGKTGHAQPWRMWSGGSEGGRDFLRRNGHVSGPGRRQGGLGKGS